MKRKLTIAALAVAAMAGCTTESESSSTESLAASFTSAITRVSGVEWESGDQIGIMVTSNNVALENYRYNNLHNVTFTDPEQGVFTPDTEADRIYFSVDASVVLHFYAYYPYSAELVEEEESYPIDVTDQSVPKKIDFMEASTRDTEGYNKEDDTVVLNFTRNMSKLTLSLVAGSGLELSDITKVWAEGYYTTATYDFVNNIFGDFAGEDYALELYDEGSNVYSAILIPENYAGERMIYFTTANGDIPLDLSAYDLTRGENRVFTVKVSQSVATYVGNSKEDWDEYDNTGTENESFKID